VSSLRGRQLALRFPAHEQCTLTNYVAGANAETVDALARCGGSGSFAALWLVGNEGDGKSHLLQGACHAAAGRGVAAAYLPQTLRGVGVEVLDGLGELGLVAIDDVAIWLGELRMEEALLALYQQLFGRGATLLLAATRAPAELDWVLPDLASRMRAAQVHRLQPLTDSERAHALKHWAAQRGLEFGDDVLEFVLRRLPRRMDVLRDAFQQLDSGALAQQRRLTVPLVKELLRL
jgi:DnaA family protein